MAAILKLGFPHFHWTVSMTMEGFPHMGLLCDLTCTFSALLPYKA